MWTAKTVKRPPQQPAQPQYANYWAPLTRKRHTLPHPAQPQHTNHWAPRTRKQHQQEHRPQRPTAATRCNMRREERVTVQGPVKKQQPDGMSHRGYGIYRSSNLLHRLCSVPFGPREKRVRTAAEMEAGHSFRAGVRGLEKLCAYNRPPVSGPFNAPHSRATTGHTSEVCISFTHLAFGGTPGVTTLCLVSASARAPDSHAEGGTFDGPQNPANLAVEWWWGGSPLK